MESTKRLSPQWSVMDNHSSPTILSYILTTIGCSLIIFSLIKIPGIILNMPVPTSASLLIWRITLYLVYCAFFIICSMLIAHFHKTERFIRFRPFFFIITGCLYAIAILVMSLTSAQSSFIFIFVLLIVLACFGSFHLYGWGVHIVSLDPSKLPLCIALSFALTDLYSLSPSPMPAVLQCIFPLISWILLLLLKWPAQQSRLSERISLRHIPWSIVSICAVLIIVWLVALGLLAQGHDSTFTDDDQFIVYLVSMLALAILAGYYAIVIFTNSVSKKTLFLYPFVILALANIAIIAFVVIDQFENFVLFKQLFVIVVRCLDALMFSLIAYSVTIRKLSHIAIFTMYTLILSSNFWMLLSRHFQSLENAASGDATVATIAAMLLSFITSLGLVGFLLRFTTKPDDIDNTDNLNKSNTLEFLNSIGATYGLTGKETEVLSLLYRGYSSKRIAQELQVSNNTIRTHTSAIYRKLSIHSRQELVAFIDTYNIDE